MNNRKQKTQGQIIIFSAPSGGGKSTIINKIKPLFKTLSFSISATTRKPRGNEKNGVEYYFLTKEEFQKNIEQNEFAEYKEVFGNFYGTLKSTLNKNITENKNTILDIDVKGALALIEQYPNAVTIFIKPPSLEILEQRLNKRQTDTPETIKQRLKEAENELSKQDNYKYIVTNNILEEAIKEVIKILRENNIS